MKSCNWLSPKTPFVRTLLIAIALSSGSNGQAEELPWTIDCQEVAHAEANDSLNGYKVKKDKAFSLTFSRTDGEHWVMIGNLGSVPVVASQGVGVIHFLERTSLGNINITQIMLHGEQTALPGVHSRHTVFGSEMMPSQYLLTCKVR